MTFYAYGPGEWTALAHEGRAALLDPSIEPDAVARIWESLSNGGSLESWLEILAGNGLAALPSFGLVEPGEDGVRVVVRGEVLARVQDHDVSAGGMRTWREHVAPAETAVVLGVGQSEASFPLVGGHVLAASIQVGTVAETDAPSPAAVPAAEQPAAEEPDGGAAETAADPAAVEPDGDDASAEPEIAEPVEAEGPVDGGSEPAGQEAAADAGPAAEGEEEVEPDFVLDDDGEDDIEGDEEPGEPEDPEGEWAAQAEGVQMVGLPDGAHAAGEAPLVPPPLQEPWAIPAPPQPHASQWGPPPPGQPVAQVAPEAPAAPDLGDHDGHTMRASDIPSPEHPVDTTLAPRDDEHEHALQNQMVAVLALSTGQQVELDRPVLIGRAPESSRFGFGETPRLVTVPSPQQDISRTHVEIKLEGDNVLVTDLRSTNGTVVVLPGSPPRRLHPGESVPVPHGTVVDLGDGVTAVVAPPNATAPIAY